MGGWPRVAVVGGSLGGLTAALVLRDLGCQVDVFERSAVELESRGAGIVVLDETVRYFRERTDLELDQLTTATGVLRYLGRDGAVVFEEPRRYRYSAWHTIYRALLGCFGRRHYHLGKELAGFQQQGDHVELQFADGTAAGYDLLVCADGIASHARAVLQPQARPAYAGYVAWRGTVEPTRSATRSSPTATSCCTRSRRWTGRWQPVGVWPTSCGTGTTPSGRSSTIS